jgi:hypothetical protein
LEGKARQKAVVTKHGWYTAEKVRENRKFMAMVKEYRKELKAWQRDGEVGDCPMF